MDKQLKPSRLLSPLPPAYILDLAPISLSSIIPRESNALLTRDRRTEQTESLLDGKAVAAGGMLTLGAWDVAIVEEK